MLLTQIYLFYTYQFAYQTILSASLYWEKLLSYFAKHNYCISNVDIHTNLMFLPSIIFLWHLKNLANHFFLVLKSCNRNNSWKQDLSFDSVLMIILAALRSICFL
jgi:hypothetical protein